FLDHAHIFGIWLLGSYFYEAASHLLHDEFVTERLYRVQFPVVPRTLQKLKHQHPHALSYCPQRRAHGGRGLALSWASIHDDQTTADVLRVRHTGQALIVPA